MFRQRSPSRTQSPALRLALIYLIGSSAWILFSDRVAAKLIGGDTLLMEQVQSAKGIVFVGCCSVLLFLVSRRYYRGMSKALARTEEFLLRYQGLGEALRDGIADHDLLNDTAVINEQMKFFMQQSESNILHFQLKHRRRIHPADLDRVVRSYNDTLATGSHLWQAEFRYLLHDGDYHDVINRGYIMRDAGQRAVRMISAIQDVSELRTIRTAIYHQEVKHQRRLSQSIIQAQEAERNRWATELHDNVCQILTVVKLYLDQVETGEQENAPLLHKAGEMTARALNDIRQLSAAIRPPEFHNTTLRRSIGDLLASVQRVKELEIDTDFSELDEDRLSDDQKLMVYRVVQEQLSNIIKYAKASRVVIGISTGEEEAVVRVIDNGQGFDPARISGGIGLKNIRSRLEVFSGSLDVDTAPGKGCRLIAQFSTT